MRKIYTAGRCASTFRNGAWAYFAFPMSGEAVKPGKHIAIQSYTDRATNERVEMLAIISALQAFPDEDLEVVVNTKEIVTTPEGRRQYPELWEAIRAASTGRTITWLETPSRNREINAYIAAYVQQENEAIIEAVEEIREFITKPAPEDGKPVTIGVMLPATTVTEAPKREVPTIIDTLVEVLGISMQEALNISVSLSSEQLDMLSDIVLETAIKRYDIKPMENILEVEEEEEIERYFAYVGDAVRIRESEMCGVVVERRSETIEEVKIVFDDKTEEWLNVNASVVEHISQGKVAGTIVERRSTTVEKVKVALTSGQEVYFPATVIELVDDDELYKSLERYKEQNQRAAAKAAVTPDNIELPKKRKKLNIVECEAYDIATLRRPDYRRVKTIPCKKKKSGIGKIHVECESPLPTWMFLNVPDVTEEWHALPNKARVGQGKAYIMGNGGYIVYPYTMMVLGDKEKSLWCAPEAFRIGDTWRNVSIITVNRQDITTDVLTSIGLIWGETFNCPLPLKKTNALYRSCKTCAFRTEGKEGGAMELSNPMGGPAHWCMVGPEAHPIDNRAVREGNLALRTYPEGVNEHSLIRFGDGWGTANALRMRDVCGSRCSLHCFPGELQSHRVRRADKRKYIIDIPGNPTEVWDDDDELMSYYPKQVKVVWHKG